MLYLSADRTAMSASIFPASQFAAAATAGGGATGGGGDGAAAAACGDRDGGDGSVATVSDSRNNIVTKNWLWW